MLYNKDYKLESAGNHMPPKPKITKEMIINVAFDLVQTEGIDKVTARSISQQLHCSTQPVLYYFATIEDIKKAVYAKADEYHSAYIMNMEDNADNPLLAIGMNYIHFAIEERNLFQFLFQSNEFTGASMLDLMDLEGILPLLTVLQQEINVSLADAKEIFSTLFIFVHGYASLYANNTMIYDKAAVAAALENVFYGAICIRKGEQDEKDI
jgi:AcrR family transcriptional regulator